MKKEFFDFIKICHWTENEVSRWRIFWWWWGRRLHLIDMSCISNLCCIETNASFFTCMIFSWSCVFFWMQGPKYFFLFLDVRCSTYIVCLICPVCLFWFENHLIKCDCGHSFIIVIIIIIIIIIIVIFIITSVFYVCMIWTVSYERLWRIPIFSYDLANFALFQITSGYLIPCFPWSVSGQTTANLEGSTFTRPSILFHFSLVLSSSSEILSSGLT